MKSDRFIEPRWLAAILGGIFFFLGGIAEIILFTILAMKYYNGASFQGTISFIICFILAITSVSFYLIFILPKCFSVLTISTDKIIWRCPFYRSVKMKIEECQYVGVEDMAAHNRVMPVIRGDETAYIYLSSSPFPEKYKHKADSVRRKKGLITFAYSDRLCEELVHILPKEKTSYLVSFYNRMQLADKAIELAQKKKKFKKK